MTDNELKEMIKKAKSMINNNDIPDNVKTIVNNIKDSNSSNNPNNNLNNNFTSTANSDNTSIFNGIDINSLIGLINNYKNSSEDDMSKLLLSLKPYLRDTKKEKIDEYLKLIQVGKITKVMEDLNKTKNN